MAHAQSASSIEAMSSPTLLGLPRELRDKIYNLVVQSSSTTLQLLCCEPIQPGLARVNKQLRSEVLPLWRNVTLATVETVKARVHEHHFDRVINLLHVLPARNIMLQVDFTYTGEQVYYHYDDDGDWVALPQTKETACGEFEYDGADLRDWLRTIVHRSPNISRKYHMWVVNSQCEDFEEEDQEWRSIADDIMKDAYAVGGREVIDEGKLMVWTVRAMY